MKRILFFLLAVVAFSSCNQKDSDDGFLVEKGYGRPDRPADAGGVVEIIS